jgi:hypothetical protein
MDTDLPTADGARPRAVGLVVAAAAPLGLIAVAWALSSISDRLLWIGPLDRAAFAWVVVVPVWLLAPSAAAIAMSGLGTRASAGIAVAVVVTAAIPAAFLTWQSAAFPGCPAGTIRTPSEMVAPAATVGAILGIGLGAACFVAAELWRDGHPRTAVLAGASIHLATSAVAFALGPLYFIGPLCQRPPIG